MISEQSEVLRKDLEWVASDTRLWSHERNRIAKALDLIDERLKGASNGTPSIWLQFVILVNNSMNLDELDIQRECFLCLGEIRQTIRQAMSHDPIMGGGVDGSEFRAQFSELLDHILMELTPDPKGFPRRNRRDRRNQLKDSTIFQKMNKDPSSTK